MEKTKTEQNKTIFELQNLCHHFGEGKKRNNVLYKLNLKIQEGQFVSLVGPSGSGKSVLLRALVGTHPPRSGNVIVYSGKNNEIAVIKKKPDRDIGIVYQAYSLFPFLTAIENVAFGLKLDQTKMLGRLLLPIGWRRLRKQHMELAEEMLNKVGLSEAKDRYPSELSGGMRQRVAIAQALIMKPRIILLDEPFGALDEATRNDLQDLLLTLYQENLAEMKKGNRPAYTVLLVTHELYEALRVGDRVLGLSPHWDWKKEHERFPGAKIVYDEPAPIYSPDKPADFAAMQRQKNKIRKAVFDPIEE
ncbi:MAG: ATP-binding cassette domain-containing protein [Acidobacteria bacterium]|nr:ATP-binding cassette domain-containing protein [Acidobacteriota bacterium]